MLKNSYSLVVECLDYYRKCRTAKLLLVVKYGIQKK